MANTDLIHIQVSPTASQPAYTRTGTDLLLPPISVAQRMRHFPDNVYDVSAESNLTKFVKVLLGDAGAGQLRKMLLLQRMQNTLQGTHFYNLDRFYGALFGIKRTASEIFDLDPAYDTATREEWDTIHTKDASFRSRVAQFARALTYGATPTGIELISEALLSVDVDLYESYIQADSGYQTYLELENYLYGANLLSDNACSVETSVVDWTAEANTSVSQSSAWAFFDGVTAGGGTNSLALQATALGDVSATTPIPTVGANLDYTFTVVANLSENLNARVEIEWYDSVPSLISTTVGTSTPATAGTATQVTVTGTSPANADSAVARLVVESSSAAAIHNFDRMEFSLLNYSLMDGVSYGTLEGLGVKRLSGDERRIFYVRPKFAITTAQKYDVKRVIDRLKPADSRAIILDGDPLVHIEQTIAGAYADSQYWEVVPKVATAVLAVSPYAQISIDLPVEQPRPPFSRYQGEAWSYVPKLAGVAAQTYIAATEENPEQFNVLPTQRVTYRDGTYSDFTAESAILPTRMVLAGRSVSDGILVSVPASYRNDLTEYYTVENTATAVARLYSDGVPLDSFLQVLKTLPTTDPFQQNPEHRYWVTPERSMNDLTEEILEIRLSQGSLVNYLTWEVSKYPHQIIAEVQPEGLNSWIEVFRWQITDSSPKVLPMGFEALRKEGHPQHSFLPNHWQKLSVAMDPTLVRKVRLKMRRLEGIAPRRKLLSQVANETIEVPYSLAIRAFDVGYRVKERADFEVLDDPATEALGVTEDLLGSLVEFRVNEQKGANVLTDAFSAWRSEPQAVNYAVVSCYLDTRDGLSGKVIDRFYIDPTHTGCHITIYVSNDSAELDTSDPEGFMAQRTWTPIPRDFTAQKGFLHIPPTMGRYWKFEFTNLAAEPFENLMQMNRSTRLFPRSVVEASMQQGTFGAPDEALLPGYRAAIDVADVNRYRDALNLLASSTPKTNYQPTEVLYADNPNAQVQLQANSWVFGFTPWHQGSQAPRFPVRSVHEYEQLEIPHLNKVAFFAGLRELKAYRTSWEASDDPMVYFDTFDDAEHLQAGFTWAFDPGALSSENTTPPVTATSKIMFSQRPVKAVQFATEQSNPVQLLPDSEFRNPALANYTWDDPDSYTAFGDVNLIYNPLDFSVTFLRYVVPPPKSSDNEDSLIQGLLQPVFSYRDYEIADLAAAQATEGGMRTPLVGLSDAGRAYAAVRFTMVSEQSSPIILEVRNNVDDSLIATKSITARKGELVEDYVGFDIPSPNTVVYLRLLQQGKANNIWRLHSLSMFDESIVWEWSVNGGADWYTAKEIRNNDNGIMTFPEPGNQLCYRVTAYRENLWVSALKIRPHYLGVGNARFNGTHRGPNVSFFDQDIPINKDPMFTTWKRPVPYYWWAAARRFPLLAVEGAPVYGEYNSFYGRPVDETVGEPSDASTYFIIRNREVEERLDFIGITDASTRVVTGNRTVLEDVDEPVVSVDWTYVYGIEGSIMQEPLHPIFEEDES